MSDKFVTLFDDVKKYMDGVFSEKQSLKDTNILHIRLLPVTLRNISNSVRVPFKLLSLHKMQINYSLNVANSVGSSNRAPILIPTEYNGWASRMRNYLRRQERISGALSRRDLMSQSTSTEPIRQREL
ncbi:hypothetical protein L2E82_35263 [Cichorium intybus]|uniref:Uncharacterized protein n=1 Tax=Cichorium intybus TaxID=13427 RepID=A0ACB9BNT7_CICIN|nr:hypothetical protein L2E82_35263 [Cichorium intybus]